MCRSLLRTVLPSTIVLHLLGTHANVFLSNGDFMMGFKATWGNVMESAEESDNWDLIHCPSVWSQSAETEEINFTRMFL